MSDPEEIYTRLREEIDHVLIGKNDLTENLTVSLLTGGHVLLEGVPGVAKTTVATLFARASGLTEARIQMTPDLLPADITGTHVYQESTGGFSLQTGPVFSNIVIVDEINRATPKTQSALLEAMQERNVTIEGETLSLPSPFMVIATQNPIEMEGTFELPEAQRDRFQLKLTVDLPKRGEERTLLDNIDIDPTLSPEHLSQVITPSDLDSARERVIDVHIGDTVKEYVLDIVEATRTHPDVSHGGSPRASIAFLNTSKARAAIRGRRYVTPDDIKTMARPVLTHRLLLTSEAELSEVTSDDVIDDVLSTVETPGSSFERESATKDGTQ
ncbi:AAA family ATPase [Natronorarus salvus]|uniref:AAA family ATPase n=1 Tax=Natronorarus salvus TaxID=3117733 RepID=UPI002F26C8EB